MKITLSKLCPALYESQELYIESEGWQKELKKYFGRRVAENPEISQRRIALFRQAVDELEEKTAEEGVWHKIIEFMVENDISSINAFKWELIYFLKECKPLQFQLRVARSIHRPDEEMNISDAELDEMIEGKIQRPDPDQSPDPDQTGWDLDVLVWFKREKVEAHEDFANFPENVKKSLEDFDDYKLEIFLLKNTTLKEIRMTLKLFDAEISDL